MTVNAPRQIRILFLNCPKLDTLACSYLILEQNNVQSIFEFSVHHFWVFSEKVSPFKKDIGYKFLEWLSERWFITAQAQRRLNGYLVSKIELEKAPDFRNELTLNEWHSKTTKVLDEHDKWWKQLTPGYGGRDTHDVATIVITETPLYGSYFASANGNLALITIADWHKLAPPSVLEFILSRVQRYAARISLTAALGSHYSTKGCIWDFDANVSDSKVGVLVGHLCQQCKTKLSVALTASEMESFQSLIRHEWIGTTDEPGSVASNLKRIFDFDLSRTKGLSQGLVSQMLDEGSFEFVKNLAKISVYVIWGSLMFWLVAHKIVKPETFREFIGK